MQTFFISLYIVKSRKGFDYLEDPKIIFLQAMIERENGNYQKSIELLQKSIKGGNAEEMFEYGKMLYKGIGLEKNQEEAKKYFTLSGKNGCNKYQKFLKKKTKLKNQNHQNQSLIKINLMIKKILI